MQSQLVSKLRTKDDLDILKGELDMIENAIYHTDIKYEDVLRSDIRSWVSEIIIRESEGQDLGSYVKKLRDDIVGVPILSASIYFEPSLSFTETISAWLKKNVSQNIVIEVLQNSSVLGGIQLSYKGKYLDLTLRKKIAKELESITLVRN